MFNNIPTLKETLKNIEKLNIPLSEKIIQTIRAIDNYGEVLKEKKLLKIQRNKNYLINSHSEEDTYLEEITEGWGRGFGD